MGDSLRNALDTVVAFLPRLLLFLIILVIGYFIAKALEKLLDKILEKVGFDRAVERGGIKKALENSSFDASSILAKIVFYAVMLFVLSTAFGVFGDNPISDYLAAIIGYLPKVFVAILILVIAAAIAAGVKTLIQSALGGLAYGRVLANVASVLILALGVVAALDQLEIAQNVVNAVLYATLAAVVGVVVVAVGGGGIAPMRQRWERALSTVEAEAPNVAREARNTAPAREALRQEARQRAARAQEQPQPAQAHGATSYSEQPRQVEQPFDQQQYEQQPQYAQPQPQGQPQPPYPQQPQPGQPVYGQQNYPPAYTTEVIPVPDPQQQPYAPPPVQPPGTAQLPQQPGPQHPEHPDQQPGYGQQPPQR